MQLIGDDIIISDKALDYLKNFLESRSYSKIIVLSDENTQQHCAPAIPFPVDKHIVVPAGEQFKNLSTCTLIWDALLESGADRSSVLINLGGGVVGDMGGFAASCYMRGIDFVQVPTSLLAMVDASVGGKVGIDYRDYKNMLGQFAPPEMVFIQPKLLDTLPERELMAGYAEMLKHGLIANAGYWLELLDFNKRRLKLQIEESVKIKHAVVEEDPDEQGKRKILNFGHTIGHALESYALTAGMDVLHGEAVAAGMFMESIVSSKAGLTKEDIDLICGGIRSLYPVLPFKQEQAEEIWNLMLKDKKNKSGKVRCVMLTTIGEALFDVDLSFPEFEEAFRNYLNF